MTADTTVELHHLLEGSKDAPVLVLANSLGTSLNMWDYQVPVLREHFRLLRYDHRGHGGSPVPSGPYGIEDLGRDVLALLNRLEIERVSFCGLSIGGMVGMWLHGEVPERVERLVLCCTSAQFAPPEGYAGCCEAIRDADLWDRLDDVRATTLVIAGADDPAAPPENGKLIRDSIPDAQLVIVSQARHLTNVEQPEEVTRAVMAHLEPVSRMGG